MIIFGQKYIITIFIFIFYIQHNRSKYTFFYPGKIRSLELQGCGPAGSEDGTTGPRGQTFKMMGQ